MVGDDRGRGLVHPQAAVLLGNIDGSEAQIRRLTQQPEQHAGLLGVDVLGGRENLVAGKLGCGGCHLQLFFVEVFRGEDLGGRAGVDKKAAALGGDDRRNGCRRHGISPTVWKHYANPEQASNCRR